MPAQIINGQRLAERYRAWSARRAQALRSQGRTPCLDAVLVDTGDNAARVYAQNQARTCEQLGIEYKLHTLPASAGHDEIAGRILLLSSEPAVSAIMLHLPLPAGVDPYRVQRLIAPEKDVEGVNPANIGNVVYGRSSLAPCTALAVAAMVQHVINGDVDAELKDEESIAVVHPGVLKGKTAVVVGAGDVVGKPIAVLLMRQDATVVSCNKWTPAIEELTRRADVLVSAVGKPGLIAESMVKPGAIVIDVGVSRVVGADGKARTVGDVDEAVRGRAAWVSPVPGGVGPMTVAMLLCNTVRAAGQQTR